eukprot:352484-Chlamydomonas_euryale.AAC.1
MQLLGVGACPPLQEGGCCCNACPPGVDMREVVPVEVITLFGQRCFAPSLLLQKCMRAQYSTTDPPDRRLTQVRDEATRQGLARCKSNFPEIPAPPPAPFHGSRTPRPVLCSTGTVRNPPPPLTVRPVRCALRFRRYGRYGHPDSGRGWEAISTPEYAYLPWSYTPSPRWKHAYCCCKLACSLMRRYGGLGERATGFGTQGCS